MADKSMLETYAEVGLNAVIGLALKASPMDAKQIAMVADMTGKALQSFAVKIADGKIDHNEIEDILLCVGAQGNSAVALAVKAAFGRIVEQILPGGLRV